MNSKQINLHIFSGPKSRQHLEHERTASNEIEKKYFPEFIPSMMPFYVSFDGTFIFISFCPQFSMIWRMRISHFSIE